MPAPSIHAFAEKVALITGGENPVGRATALQLALNGCYVIVAHSGSDVTARNLLNELKNLGTLAHFIEADYTNEAGAGNLLNEVEKIFGRLDLLINCAGTGSAADFESCDEQLFTETVNQTLKTIFFVSRAAIKLMQARPKPKIVNIVTAAESDANPLTASLLASIAGLTESLSKSLPAKFRVNCLTVKGKENGAPDMTDELFRQSTGLQPDDAARAVLFLLSGESIGINGANTVVR